MRLWWPWNKNERHPSIVENNERFKRFDQSAPIESYEYVSLDTELTGLDSRKDAIVSIGAVRMRGLQIIAGANFFTYVQPKRSLPKVSTLIHRITPDQLENAPDLSSILPELIEFIGGSLIVGHFISLDMGFINKASKRLLHGKLINPGIDTMKLAKSYQDLQQATYFGGGDVATGYSLTALSKKFGLPEFEQHDALGDAFQTACLFLFLVNKLQAFGGCRTLKDLRSATSISPFW